MLRAILQILLYAVIIVMPAILVSAFYPSSKDFVYELGRNAALAGVMIILLQVLLAARIKWIERPFGLDVLIRFHKYMAVFAAALLALHPVLLAAGSGQPDLLISLKQPWYIWLGKITLLLLLVNVGVSLCQRRLNLTFERWRILHDILGPAVLVLGFIHSISVGSDLLHPLSFIMWIIVFAVVVAVFVWHRLLRPRRLRRHRWRVTAVQAESPHVWTVKLAPPEGVRVFDYLPGQFQFITFFRGRNLPVEEHHWTISSSPAEKKYVSSTIKNLGDFTGTIYDTRPGDTAAVHGPFGRFSYALHPEETDLVFLTGGIGVTPMMSMLRHMRDTQSTRSVLMLYGNPRAEEILFRGELEEIQEGGCPRLTVVNVLSDPEEDWNGESGIIDAKIIGRYCGPELSGKTFYVCGPQPLIASVVSALYEMGVSHRHIRVEIFSFLD